MSHIAGQGQHRSNSTRTNRAALIIVFVIALAVTLGIGAWVRNPSHGTAMGPARAECRTRVNKSEEHAQNR